MGIVLDENGKEVHIKDKALVGLTFEEHLEIVAPKECIETYFKLRLISKGKNGSVAFIYFNKLDVLLKVQSGELNMKNVKKMKIIEYDSMKEEIDACKKDDDRKSAIKSQIFTYEKRKIINVLKSSNLKEITFLYEIATDLKDSGMLEFFSSYLEYYWSTKTFDELDEEINNYKEDEEEVDYDFIM